MRDLQESSGYMESCQNSPSAQFRLISSEKNKLVFTDD